MSRAKVIATALLCCAFALPAAATAGPALVKVNSVILRADGGFQPRHLPKRQYWPIDFQGYIDIAAKGGGRPVILEEAAIDFDRDGRLSAGGLPICPPERVANASVGAARRACRGAMVGTGRVEALVPVGAGTVLVDSPLTLFNGPRQGGEPSVVIHARVDLEQIETFVMVVPIEKRPGEFRYRATLTVPPIAAGLGAITHLEVDVGRRFSVDGQRRSYVSARCSDGVLRTHGRFRFSDETIIDGSVEKFCAVRD